MTNLKHTFTHCLRSPPKTPVNIVWVLSVGFTICSSLEINKGKQIHESRQIKKKTCDDGFLCYLIMMMFGGSCPQLFDYEGYPTITIFFVTVIILFMYLLCSHCFKMESKLIKLN